MNHIAKIPKGEDFQVSKIVEEICELQDAHDQKNPLHVLVEAADVLNATTRFCWRHYKIPAILMIATYFVRRMFKPMKAWAVRSRNRKIRKTWETEYSTKKQT